MKNNTYAERWMCLLLGIVIGIILSYLMALIATDRLVNNILPNINIEEVSFDLNETALIEGVNNTFGASIAEGRLRALGPESKLTSIEHTLVYENISCNTFDKPQQIFDGNQDILWIVSDEDLDEGCFWIRKYKVRGVGE